MLRSWSPLNNGALNPRYSTVSRNEGRSLKVVIDAHAHLTDEVLYHTVDAVLCRAAQGQVQSIVNVATDPESWERACEMSARYPQVLHAAATPPQDAIDDEDRFFPLVARAAAQGELIAIGETGLDCREDRATRSRQQEYLVRYLELAHNNRLPVVFHCRGTFQALFDIVDSHAQDLRAMVHCFTGTAKEAVQCLERGWYLSISGIVTFKNSTSLREVIGGIPLDRILIETDAPYLAPQSHRGGVNEPSYLMETAQMMAQIHHVSLDDMMRITTHNAHQFFSFPKPSLRV